MLTLTIYTQNNSSLTKRKYYLLPGLLSMINRLRSVSRSWKVLLESHTSGSSNIGKISLVCCIEIAIAEFLL